MASLFYKCLLWFWGLDLSFTSDVRRRVRAHVGIGGFPLSPLTLFSHLLNRRALYPLRLVRFSVPGVLSASSSQVRSSGVDVVQLGGGVTTRGWSVCVRWSRILGFCREFLKLLGGTKSRRGGRLALCSRLSCGPWSLSALEVPFNSKSRLASTPASVGVVVFAAGSIVVVQWRRCRLWPVRRVARMLLSISLPLLGYLFILGQLKFTCLRFSEMGDCQGVRMLLVVSIDFESPSCLGVLKIVQVVHERFSPRFVLITLLLHCLRV
ncbi:hypothetical protein DY000_02031667 [Brassica cretica]|uniref:Transmembrane protein n=1 Tax=Brassica cretica TaxID=69181 RepID=A0ABQ7DQ25_BRACR|nr:hypothetical protein DY000_02031667 [Brassica cretica]